MSGLVIWLVAAQAFKLLKVLFVTMFFFSALGMHIFGGTIRRGARPSSSRSSRFS